MLIAVRQEDCDEAILTTARPFEKDASWSVRDADTGEESTVSGEFTLTFEKPRTARLFFIRRA